MSDVKQLIDQYAAENQQLRQQAEGLLLLVRDMTVMFKDNKNQVRIPGKIRQQADKFGLDINSLKTSVVLTLKVKTEE